MLPDTDFACCGKSNTYGKRKSSDGNIPLGKTCFCYHLDSGSQDGSKHHNSTSAENRIRKGSKKVSYRRKQSGQDHANGAGHDGETVYDLCHDDNTYVLAEGCSRKPAEEGVDDTDDTVSDDASGHFFRLNRTV